MTIVEARVTAKEVYRKVNRRILPMLLICYTFAYLDRVNIGFAKLHMQEDMPMLTDAVFGVASGIFFLAYATLEIPSNLLMNRIGARRTITRIMVLWGLASSLTMFVTEPWQLYTLRIILGIFEAGFAPGIILYLTYWYPAKRMAAVMGVYMLAGPIGSILGSGGSALVIAGLDGVGGLSGWQWMFPIQGLPAVALGIIFWKLMSDTPDEAKWLNKEELAVIHRDRAETESNHTASRFVDALKNVQVHVMALAYFGIMCGIYATTFWMPTILKENGIENNTVNGLLTALPYFVTIPVMVLLTRSSDRSQDRFWHALVPTLLAAVALVAAAVLSANFWISYLALCVAVFSVWGAYTVFWAVPSKAFGGTAAAGGIAYINTMGILGGFVAPMIIGFVKTATGSTEGGLLTMVGLLILSAGALVVLKKVLFDKEKEEAPIEL